MKLVFDTDDLMSDAVFSDYVPTIKAALAIPDHSTLITTVLESDAELLLQRLDIVFPDAAEPRYASKWKLTGYVLRV